MKFTVTFHGYNTENFEGTYKIQDAGVLRVETDDGRLLVFSPSFWGKIQVSDPESVAQKRGLLNF